MDIQARVVHYISRYAPSRSRILTYLDGKKISNKDEFLEQIHYDEWLMCDMWMRTFISLGKWRKEIFQKLYKKEFPKTLITEKIALIESELSDWDLFKNQIHYQIQTLLSRGKSTRSILVLLLGKYPYFREQIESYMTSADDIIWLKKEVQKYKIKYNLSIPQEKQKFYAAIMRKWFSYDAIRSELNNPF